MKRTFIIYTLLLACALTGMRCTEEISPAIPTEEELETTPYTSYWYYTYEALETVDYETMGLEAAADFKPYAVAQRGDTLFVANIGTAGQSMILYSKKAKRPLTTIKTWTFNDAEKNFTSNINAIVVTDDRLYVAEQQSLIHVFSLPGMEYYSCIGNGDWGGPVFQAQAMTVKDGLVFARNKNGRVRVYKESDVTPENYQKINYYKETGPGAGNSANNAFAAHYMEVDKDGHIMLTGYEAQSIRVLDPALINDDFKNVTNIDIDELTWALPFKPKTFAMTAERMYATGSNDAVSIYDMEKEEWVKTLKSIKGFAFTRPDRVFAQNDSTLWVSDISKCALVQMGVFKGEIREYEPVAKNVVKVRAALTRSGEPEEFYVDLRTHEIIDPEEAE
ncbi:MAG: quinoprotein amine dehydrogenase [Alistipes sp.]|nr:quinoprotein amine dehydrogenase [Alistipes sp.]